MVGIGGVLTEALGDVAFRLVPLTDADADDMLDELRTQALLGPVRGEHAVDRDALARRARSRCHGSPRTKPTSCRSTSTR